MVVHCMNALKEEHINKVSLIAFTQNDIGNAFWKCIGWTKREDLNYYDFTLNEENITAFNLINRNGIERRAFQYETDPGRCDRSKRL